MVCYSKSFRRPEWWDHFSIWHYWNFLFIIILKDGLRKKTPLEQQDLKSFWSVIYPCVGRLVPPTHGIGAPASQDPSQTYPVYLHPAVRSYSFSVNEVDVILSSLSHQHPALMSLLLLHSSLMISPMPCISADQPPPTEFSPISVIHPGSCHQELQFVQEIFISSSFLLGCHSLFYLSRLSPTWFFQWPLFHSKGDSLLTIHSSSELISLLSSGLEFLVHHKTHS